MAGQVAEEVKDERLARLQALLDEQQQAFNAAQVGRALPVLFEKPGRHPGQIAGRSPYLQAVHATGRMQRRSARSLPVRSPRRPRTSASPARSWRTSRRELA